MIVDDSDINRNFLKTIFEDNYRIIEAADGEEAIKLVESCGQDLSLILLDYVMPNKNGLDVMKYICEKGLRETLPVIIVTGDSDSDIALFTNTVRLILSISHLTQRLFFAVLKT